MTTSRATHILFLLVLVALPLAAQQPEQSSRTSPATPTLDPTPEAKAPDQDAEEAGALLREMEVTLEQIGQAQIQVSNVRRIVDKLDQGAVQATEKELVKTNKFVRQQLARDFRELRARARSVMTQVKTVLLPKQRGVGNKLKTRWELETDEGIKSKIAKLLGEHEQAMSETTDQLRALEGNIGNLSAAIQILENQLSYLELVEESLGLSKQIASQLKDLNQEIDKVVSALMEKEMRQ